MLVFKKKGGGTDGDEHISQPPVVAEDWVADASLL